MSDLAINFQSQTSSIQQNVKVGVATSADAGELIGLAEFNARAGIHPHGKRHYEPTSLPQRRLAEARRRAPEQRANVDVEYDDNALGSVAAEAIDALLYSGKSALEAQLTAQYDALERHALLRDAITQVDEKDIGESEKSDLKKALGDMLSDLEDKGGDLLRTGLKNAQSFENTLGTMLELFQEKDGGDAGTALREMRYACGAKTDGKLEVPLTPLALATSLQDKFGTANFTMAMADVRSKMAAQLRSNPAGSPGPRLWLSLSDAASFNLVQSAFSIAGDLRRDLSQRATITPKASQGDTTLTLLEAAEPSSGKADSLLGKLVHRSGLNILQHAQLSMLLRLALEKLPLTLWPSERLSQRMELLDELRALVLGISEKLPAANSPDEQLAHQLREGAHRKKVRDRDRDRDGDQQKDSDDRENGDETGGAKAEA